VLSVDTSDLYVIFVSDGLMEVWVLHELWKVDVNGSSKSGTKVSWAGRNVTEMLIVSEFAFCSMRPAAVESLLKTAPISDPFCMEMILS
jgi:hypothetical protein